MTIAAGFVNFNGVLLCADTLTTDSLTNTVFQSKIIPVFFPDGKAFFAFSGGVTFAKSVVDQCGERLRKHNAQPRTCLEIADTIRKQWIPAFREAHNAKDFISSDQILCAIYSEREKSVSLHSSSNTAFGQSSTGIECIGAGDSLARYLARSFPFSSISNIHSQHAFEIGIYALGRIKDFMRGAVGGNLAAVQLNHDGTEHLYSQTEIELIELYTHMFESVSRDLLIRLMDHRTAMDFDAEVDRIAGQVKWIREQWGDATKAAKSSVEWPPQELTDAFQKAKH